MAELFRVGTPRGTVAWSDGSAFTGFINVGFKQMTSSGTTWTDFNPKGRAQKYPLAKWTKILIKDGVIDGTAKLPYNDDIVPPGTEYVAWYYDANGVQIGGPTAAFTVSTGEFTPPTVTLTAPSAGSNPTPD